VRIPLLLAAAGLSFACTAKKVPSTDSAVVGQSGDTVHVMLKDDPQLAATRVDAKRTLAEFIDRFCKPPHYQKKLALKLRFAEKSVPPYPEDSLIEYMWVDPIRIRGVQFTGTLLNTPLNMKGVRLGDTVTMDTALVSDWFATDGDTLAAGFSLRLLRNGASDRAAWDKQQGFIVLPDTIERRRRGLDKPDALKARLASRLAQGCG
jgi:uncharacterized protein YegJ (DUF2314 family)